MEKCIDYIEDSLAGIPDDGTLYRYKRKVLEEMDARADEITHAGLKDDQVMTDLLCSEYPDLKSGFQKFAEEDRLKRRARTRRKAILIGTPLYVLLLVALYLAVSFLTGHWAQTWLIIVGGIFLLVLFLEKAVYHAPPVPSDRSGADRDRRDAGGGVRLPVLPDAV